ncbi:MAG: cell division protein FtsZ [Candidatus Pacebacteria bacterium]|nr:cell division protein FtsZ [Candidatus Paceibacterota bacterium]
MTIIRLPSNSKQNNPPVSDPKEMAATAVKEDDLIASLKNGQDLDELDVSRKILVLGLGGNGCNAIRNLEQLNPTGVQMLACNTDLEDLRKVKQEHRFLIGAKTTRGQGAGSNPIKGMRAMEEQLPQLMARIGVVDMVILVAGMGGGTGTGSAPVIAKALRETGATVVSIITMPESSNGMMRMKKAIDGKQKLEAESNSIVTILNDKLPQALGHKGSLQNAFKFADSVLLDGISNIIDVMNILGIDNLDYADIETALSGTGKTMISVGHAEGENAGIIALEKALYHPIIEPCNIRSATHAMVNIIIGEEQEDSLMLSTTVRERLNLELDVQCDVKSGLTQIAGMKGVRILVIMSGMDGSDGGEAVVRMPRIAPNNPRDNLTLVLSDRLPPTEPEALMAEETLLDQGLDFEGVEEVRTANSISSKFDDVLREELHPSHDQMATSAAASAASAPAVAPAVARHSAVETKTRVIGIGGLIQKFVNGQTMVTTTEEELEAHRREAEAELERKQLEETLRRAKEMEIPPIPRFLNRFSS